MILLNELIYKWPWYFPTVFFIVGLCFGSFANVVIYRLPAKKSVVRPRSTCPQCGHLIRWFENIPVFSWIFLQARCSSCQTSISYRYPLVELLTGFLFMGIYLKLGFSFFLLESLIFAFLLVVASFIDFDHRILPDKITLPGILLGLIGAALNPEREFLPSFLGVLVGGGFLYALAYLYLILRKRDGMGGGDIKLLGWIGAVLGVQSVPFVILISSLLGSAVGLGVAMGSKDGLKSGIPFGPYLSLAALGYLFFGPEVFRWYLGFFTQDFYP